MSFPLVPKCVLAAALIATGWLHAEQVFPVVGVVRAPLADGTIVVTHEEIVGYMPAMTMRFVVSAAVQAQAAPLRPGDRVAFSLHVDEERAQADGFRVIGHAAEPVVRSRASIARLHEGDMLPSFALLDERNHGFTNADLAGHLTVLTFIFTRCPVPEFCPLVSRRFGELQREIVADAALRTRVHLLSITLDPEFDRPDVLDSYGKAVGADPAIWHFATGTASDIDALVKAFSVYTERNGVTLDHTLCTALIGADGRILQIWRGNGWANDEIVQALRSVN